MFIERSNWDEPKNEVVQENNEEGEKVMQAIPGAIGVNYGGQSSQLGKKVSNVIVTLLCFFAFGALGWILHAWTHPMTFKNIEEEFAKAHNEDGAKIVAEMGRVCPDSSDTSRSCLLLYNAVQKNKTGENTAYQQEQTLSRASSQAQEEVPQ